MPLSSCINGTLPRNHIVIHLQPQSSLCLAAQSCAEGPGWQQGAQLGYSYPSWQINPFVMGGCGRWLQQVGCWLGVCAGAAWDGGALEQRPEKVPAGLV